MTSHDVVDRVRRLVPKKVKVGHLGTLDPAAAGVLPLAVGSATKLIGILPDFVSSAKAYLAEIELGVQTLTDDLEGELIGRFSVDGVRDWPLERWQEELNSFIGDIDQVPPQVSAVRRGGQRAYERVRKGQIVELEARPIKIALCQARSFSRADCRLRFFLVCSSGTYVRSIARDLGNRLGVGGALAFLVRTLSAPFDLESSVTLEHLQQEGISAFLLPESFPFQGCPRWDALLSAKGEVVQGQFFPGVRYLAPNGIVVGLNDPGQGRVEALFSSLASGLSEVR